MTCFIFNSYLVSSDDDDDDTDDEDDSEDDSDPMDWPLPSNPADYTDYDSDDFIDDEDEVLDDSSSDWSHSTMSSLAGHVAKKFKIV